MFKYKKTNNAVLWMGILAAALIAFFIIPGLDFIAWRLLYPQDYWEKIALIILEVLTAFPRGLLAVLTFILLGNAAVTISEGGSF